MTVYPEVPMYWYGILGIIAFILSIIVIEAWDTQLPVWGLLLALLLGAFFVVPVGIIQAITNQTVSLQVLAELIVGYILPGRPVAMMIFKTFSFISLFQAISFSADLKVGHYMKIPPRTMFTAQVAATTLSVFVAVLVQRWMFSNIPDICAPDQKSHFICPGTSVFALSAMVWGGVGPSRMFSAGALYNPLLWFFLIGAVLPVPFYYLARKYPLSYWRFVNVPVMFAGVGVMPPATGINFSAWFTVGAIFQYFMRRYHFRVRLFLQIPSSSRSNLSLIVVDALQLHPLRRSRHGRRIRPHRHLLCAAAAQGRIDIPELVGQHRLDEHPRRDGCAVHYAATRRDVRSELMVVKNSSHSQSNLSPSLMVPGYVKCSHEMNPFKSSACWILVGTITLLKHTNTDMDTHL